MSIQKWKRNLSDFKQKHEIIDYAMKHHKSTQLQIADYLSIFRKLPVLVKRRTVGDIPSNKKFTIQLPANDTIHVNKFDDLQKLYLQTIISVSCLYHEILFL